MVARSEASTIETGPSAMMMRGRIRRARATMIRRRCPGLNWCGYAPASRQTKPDSPQRLLDQRASPGRPRRPA
jgi:hypothetical protein